MVAKMQEGQVQLLLDDRGVHLNLDSAGKRVEEGERKRGWKKKKEEKVFKLPTELNGPLKSS